MKIKGALFYLQAEISGNYTTITAMQSNSMTINQETVEITDKSMLFRELLENAGIGSVSTKAQVIVSDSASYQFIKDSVISGTIINCKLLSNTGEVYSGGFYRDWETDRKSTRLNSSHSGESRMPSSA